MPPAGRRGDARRIGRDSVDSHRRHSGHAEAPIGSPEGRAGCRRARAVNTSEGDIAHQANLARQTHSVDGTGIGILSNGVDVASAFADPDKDTLTYTVRSSDPVVTAGNRDYDVDDDGLIEVATLAQLAGRRYDLNGNGAVDVAADLSVVWRGFLRGRTGLPLR